MLQHLSSAPDFWANYLQCEEGAPERAAIFFADHHSSVIDLWTMEGTQNSITLPIHKIIQQSKCLHTHLVMVVHTHPSGNPHPSAEDVTTTRLLATRLRQQRQRLADHIILTRNLYFSFRSNHML